MYCSDVNNGLVTKVLNDADIEIIKSMCPDVTKFKLQECLPVNEIKPTLKLEHAI